MDNNQQRVWQPRTLVLSARTCFFLFACLSMLLFNVQGQGLNVKNKCFCSQFSRTCFSCLTCLTRKHVFAVNVRQLYVRRQQTRRRSRAPWAFVLVGVARPPAGGGRWWSGGTFRCARSGRRRLGRTPPTQSQTCVRAYMHSMYASIESVETRKCKKVPPSVPRSAHTPQREAAPGAPRHLTIASFRWLL